MLFSYVGRQRRIGDNKKCRQIAGDFDSHADAAVRCGAIRLMEHIPGFTRSHWMPPSGKCRSCIAPAAPMVSKFVETTQNTNKTQLLACDYCTFLLVNKPIGALPGRDYDSTLYSMEWHIKKGGERSAGYGLKEKERSM